MDDLHTHTGDHSFLKAPFASVPRFEFGDGFLGCSGGGPPKERRWAGNLRLEGVGRSAELVVIEFQCNRTRPSEMEIASPTSMVGIPDHTAMNIHCLNENTGGS